MTHRTAALTAAILALLTSQAQAQRTPVFQSGTSHVNAPAKYTTQGLLTDGSGLTGDALGKGLLPFGISDSLALGLCSNSAATKGEYQAFCLGHDSSGNALLTIDAYNGALDKTFYVRKNGTLYEWPGNGAGTTLGPVTSTTNEPAVWNNGSGTLLKDGKGAEVYHDAALTAITGLGSALTVHSNAASGVTAANIWAGVNMADTASAGQIYDTIRAVLVTPTASPSTTPIAAGISSYVLNNYERAPGSGFPQTINFIAEAISNADYAGSWLLNLLCTDNYGQVAATRAPRYCFNEFDYNFTSPNSQGIGLMFGGNSIAQPVYAAGVSLQRLDGYVNAPGVIKWYTGYDFSDGATLRALNIGATDVTAKITAYISGSTLTVVSIDTGGTGIIKLGSTLTGVGVTADTTIDSQLSGTSHGVGTYHVTIPQTVASAGIPETMYIGAQTGSQAIYLNAYDDQLEVATGIIQMSGFKNLLLNVPLEDGGIMAMVDTVPRLSVTGIVEQPAITGGTPPPQGGVIAALNGARFRNLNATWANNQSCKAGDLAVDNDYIYVCVGTDTVKRAALSAF